jgi:hypothetical protein
MYLSTVGATEMLTLKTPYPSCQAKRCPASFAQREEFALIAFTAGQRQFRRNLY